MSAIVNWNGHLIRVTRRSNAVRLKLRYTPGSDFFDLTVPPGTPKSMLEAFLKESEPWLREHACREQTDWHASLAPGERAMLAGKRVTLGRDGIPSGEAFLRYRNARLTETLKRLLPLWEKRMGVSVTQITIREMKTKWGSCVVKPRRVTLNANLGAMPEELTEYVLVHELTHLHHPDHSPAFHAEMTLLMPDWKARKERLNHFGPLFFPPEEEV